MISYNLNKRSLLWKVSGKGLKKPSYIFGTMHLVCAEDFLIKEKVKKALAKCSTLVMEVDLANMEEMALMNTSLPPIRNISDDLNEKEKEELNMILQRDFGCTLTEADKQSPMSLLNQMIVQSIGCEEMKVFEMEFIFLAQKNGLQTAGLETAQQQMEIAEKIYTSKELLRQLRTGDNYKEVFQKMAEAYKKENLHDLNILLSDRRFLSEPGEQQLLTTRNHKWAKTIPSLIKKQSCFIAVGAGHLGGKNGILYLLQKKGYSVNPVYD